MPAKVLVIESAESEVALQNWIRDYNKAGVVTEIRERVTRFKAKYLELWRELTEKELAEIEAGKTAIVNHSLSYTDEYLTYHPKIKRGRA